MVTESSQQSEPGKARHMTKEDRCQRRTNTERYAECKTPNQSEFRGIVNYYLLACNVSHFGKLHGVMEMSLARTLAAKHKSTARKMRRQYKSVVETEHGPRACLNVVKQQDNGNGRPS